MNFHLKHLVSLSVFLFLMSLGGERLYGDWPQINGPHRNGVASNETLLSQWPKDLNELWTHPVGSGYSGPVVAEGRVILFIDLPRRILLRHWTQKQES